MKTVSYLRTHRGLVRSWFGVLGAPAAWAFMLLTNAFLGESLSCSPGAIAGLATDRGITWAVAAVNAACALVAVLALVVSLAAWRRLRDSDRSTGRRAEWFAVSGIMVSVLFLLIILAAYLPLVFLHPPCAPTP